MDLDLNALLQTPNAALAIAVVLGLAIFFHEAGHFITARLCGIGVEEFAMGFGPLLWQRRRGATVYSLRLLPFGGFARISGMDPGTYDAPDGLYQKPRWMQAIVFVGGVTMNIVLAMLFFVVVAFWQGLPDPTAQTVLVTRAFPGSPAAAAGFSAGDQVVALDGNRRTLFLEDVKPGSLAQRWGLVPGMVIAYLDDQPVALAGEVAAGLAKAGGRKLTVTVVDPGATTPGELFRRIDVTVPAELADQLEPVADNPARSEPLLASALGVEWGPLNTSALSEYIARRPGRRVTMTVQRKGQLVSLAVVPQARWERVAEPGPDGSIRTPHRQVGRIGVVLSPPMRRPGVFEGVKQSVVGTFQSIALMITALRAMIQREISAELGGPIAIMALTAEQARIGWSAVLSWGGLISANLAILNLLPIPPFDGFHLVMVGWEALTRRRVSDRVRNFILVAGFFFVIFIFAAFTYHDIINLVRYRTP